MGYIPVIDFGSCGLKAKDGSFNGNMLNVGELLYDALKTCGFAYLKNCGISHEEIDNVNAITQQFFVAPVEEKNRYAKRPDNFGYVGIHTEQLDPANPIDCKEAFNVNGNAFSDPDINWPSDISPQFFLVLKDFVEKCKLLTLNILKVLGVGMKLADTNHFVKSHSLIMKKGNCTTLRTLFYPPMLGDDDIGYIRLGTHSDYGSITLLFQDSVGGLQVQNLEGEFVDATPIENTVLINIGDLLQFWSQNRLKSTKHRVVNVIDPKKQNQARRSLAYFVHPNDDVCVNEDLIFKDTSYDSCTTTKNSSASKQGLTSYEYLQMKFDQTYQ